MAAKRRLEYGIAAGDDLESIQRYIEAENPKAAARVIAFIAPLLYTRPSWHNKFHFPLKPYKGIIPTWKN